MHPESDKIYTGLFNDSFYPVRDGVAVAVENYAHWLPDYGMSPLVVTPWNSPSPVVDYPLIRYFSLPVMDRKPYRFGMPWVDPTIWHRLRKTRFSLIHSHSPFSCGKLAMYAAHKQNVPLIATFHSKFRSDLQRSLHGQDFIIDRVLKMVINFFDQCDEVWIPQHEVEETIREYGFKGAVNVVPNGNDFANMPVADIPAHKSRAKVECRMPSDRLALLFVGQHIKEKGLPLIVDTLTALKGRGVPFVMNFVGDGYARGWLKQQLERNGLEDCVKLCGPIQQREELCRMYAASDLLFFPSPYDNAPLVVREAAANGTPSILLRGSTSSEIATDRHDAFLCTDKPQDCASMIEALSADREAVLNAGLRASESISRSWQDIVQEVADRYKAAIARKRKY